MRNINYNARCKKYEEIQIVILPTEDHTSLVLNYKTHTIWFRTDYLNSEEERLGKYHTLTNQHAYLLSKRKPVKGDFMMCFAQGMPVSGKARGHFISEHTGDNVSKLNAICNGTGVIIATTDMAVCRKKNYCASEKGVTLHQDKNGTYKWEDLMPSCSLEFVKEFCNKNCGLDGKHKFCVEYEEVYIEPSSGIHSNRGHFEEKLKVDEENEIIVFPFIEKTYSKDELVSHLMELDQEIANLYHHNFDTGKWIEERLK